MTADRRARQLANRWFAAAVTAFVVRLALAAVGIDLIDMPLGLATYLAFAMSMKHSGWADGYRARLAAQNDTEVS